MNHTEIDQALAEIARGQRAAALLADPMLAAALAALRDGVRDMFFDLPEGAADARERLHLMDRARQHFESAFLVHIHSGDIAKAELASAQAAADQLDQIQERVRMR